MAKENSTKENQYLILDSLISEIQKHNRGMGSLALFQNGKPVYTRAYGQSPEISNPILRLGSISKIYTAVIILKLVENKQLQLSSEVSSFFPELPYLKGITVEHLLRHRSGIENFTDQSDYTFYMEKPMSEAKLIESFKKLKIQFEPNSKYDYSNTGYVLLSLIAERVSKKSFADLLELYITDPLKLKNTYVFDSQKRRSQEVGSFLNLNGKWTPSTNTHQSIPMGSGAIASTSDEVARFLTALYELKLVNQQSLDLMLSMQDNYGIGLMTFPFHDKKVFGHTGGIDGFASVTGFIKEESLVFVNLTNASAFDLNQLNLAALSAFYKKPFTPPTITAIFSISKIQAQKYSGTFSNKEQGLEVKIFEDGGVVYAQPKGQPSFPLEPSSEHKFSFARAGLTIEFDSTFSHATFIQGKETIILTKTK